LRIHFLSTLPKEKSSRLGIELLGDDLCSSGKFSVPLKVSGRKKIPKRLLLPCETSPVAAHCGGFHAAGSTIEFELFQDCSNF
jgi:hypothetical protein